MLWASAVRCQLERWDSFVSRYAMASLQPNLNPAPESPIVVATEEIWQGQIDRHFLLIAAANMLKAISLLDPPPAVDPLVAAELREARDLNEHWSENMPVFNTWPRSRSPKYPSGRDFAKRNPRSGPYCWWAWNSQSGPLVTPNVSAMQLHSLVNAIVEQPGMGVSGHVREASPVRWIQPTSDGGAWWPDP